MLLLLIFITVAFIVIAGITLTNAFFFPRLEIQKHTGTLNGKAAEKPFVSILIPARNEAAIIVPTLDHLIRQEYKHCEIIVLDDHSEDGTGELARSVSPTIRVIEGEPLPEGWSGKNWACHQLAQAAKGDVFIFTDADVQWSEEGVGALVRMMTEAKADLFTVWPTQITHTAAERLVVPMMALVVLAYLPVIGVHFTPFSVFAAANGQCMAWRRNAYVKVGGHQRVSDNVLEDVTLARIAKSEGLRLRMAEGAGLVSCRMYTDWPGVRDGYAKNIIAGYGNSVLFLGLAGVFHWMLFLFPWGIFVGSFIIEAWQSWRLWSVVLILMGLTIRALTARLSQQRLIDSLGMPVSVILMTAIAYRSIVWHFRGGPSWKGRKMARGRKAANKT